MNVSSGTLNLGKKRLGIG